MCGLEGKHENGRVNFKWSVVRDFKRYYELSNKRKLYEA